jgi:hypothetical protein
LIQVFNLSVREGYAVVRVQIRHGVISEDVDLILDTGAARTMISKPVAGALGIDLRLGRPTKIAAAGATTDATIHQAAVEILGHSVPHHDVLFADFAYNVTIDRKTFPCRGVLGNDLLRSAKIRAVIDVSKNRAVLATHPLR